MYQFTKKFEDACTLVVEVSTSQGSAIAKEYGADTILKLVGLNKCNLKVEANNGVRPVAKLIFKGNAELRVLIKALKYAVKKLEAVYEVTK